MPMVIFMIFSICLGWRDGQFDTKAQKTSYGKYSLFPISLDLVCIVGVQLCDEEYLEECNKGKVL